MRNAHSYNNIYCLARDSNPLQSTLNHILHSFRVQLRESQQIIVILQKLASIALSKSGPVDQTADGRIITLLQVLIHFPLQFCSVSMLNLPFRACELFEKRQDPTLGDNRRLDEEVLVFCLLWVAKNTDDSGTDGWEGGGTEAGVATIVENCLFLD